MVVKHRTLQITAEGDKNHNETKKMKSFVLISFENNTIICIQKLRIYTRDMTIIEDASEGIQQAVHNKKTQRKWYHNQEQEPTLWSHKFQKLGNLYNEQKRGIYRREKIYGRMICR